ncbi:MAG: ATP synthase F1 subunit gamma [Bacteroidia bacterium]|nr:ATP synthase F1 subunit gamma [Bacteroidia bacterium]
MANLKEVRNRIVSVNSTSQITSAMKMVSAAKLKRATDAITGMRPYANKLKDILDNVSANLGDATTVYSKVPAEITNVLIVAISSNRGLAGAFNSNVIKKTNQLIKNDFAGKKVSVLCIGKKVNDAFRRTDNIYKGEDIPTDLNSLFDNLAFDRVREIGEAIMKTFKEGKFEKIVLVYNQFKNAAVQYTQVEDFLPLVATKTEGPLKKEKARSIDYIFSPSLEYIIGDLIPRTLKIQLFKALLDSVASEHGARMTAMHKATDNAKDMLKELRLTYNKARQASITKEILEIVAGAEALNG